MLLWRFAAVPRRANVPAPPADSNASPATSGASNVLLITLDTTRADHLGCYGSDAALTPALDGLAARGTLFEQAFTTCPMTLPAHTSILTGLDPPEHGLRVNGKSSLGASIQPLAELLAERGYRTGAFVAAFVVSAKFGLQRGFQKYDDDLTSAQKQEVAEPLSVYRAGNLVTDAALAWLEETVGSRSSGAAGAAPGEAGAASRGAASGAPAAPFFCWVHLYDPHYPYFAHAELAGTRFEGAASYDAEIAFMDTQVARLLAFLDERRLTDRTLVIAVADHGEGLDDHGEPEHGYLLNEEVLRVPLIMALPGRVREGQRTSVLASLVDLFPTVLDLLGMPAEARGRGRSLVPALRGETLESLPSYAETDLPYTVFGWSPLRSLTTAHWKYIRTTRPELYDRTTDLRELYNLASARPEQAKELEAALAETEGKMRVQTAPAVALDASQRRRLEALGYVTGGQSGASEAPVGSLKDIKDMLPVKHLDTQLTRGIAFGTMDQTERLEIARELVKRSPETAPFQNRLGLALVGAGKRAEAIGHFEEAVRLAPDLADAHNNLANALAAQGKPEEAAHQYAEALRVEPDFAEAHFGMGNVLADQGTLDTALGHYAEAVRLEPDYTDAHFNMANALARRGKVVAASEHYREALRLRSDFVGAHYNLANLLADQGQLEEAVAEYTEALRLEPDMLDARNNLGAALARQGKVAEAKEQYLEALRIKPGFARAHYNLGRLLARQGSFAEAIKHHGEAVRLRPNDAEFADGLASILATCEDAQLRNPGRAVELAEKACGLTRRRDPRMLGTLAAAYAQAGRLEEAVQTARRAMQLARATEARDLAAEIERRLQVYESRRPSARPGGAPLPSS